MYQLVRNLAILSILSYSLTAQVFDPVAVDVSMIGFLGFEPKATEVFNTTHPGCEGCDAHASLHSQLWDNGGWADYPADAYDKHNFDVADGDDVTIARYTINGPHGDITVVCAGIVKDGECAPVDITTPPWECAESAKCNTLIHITISFPGNGDYNIVRDDGVSLPIYTTDDQLIGDELPLVLQSGPSTGVVCDEVASYKSSEITIRAKNASGGWDDLARVTISSYCGSCNVKESN